MQSYALAGIVAPAALPLISESIGAGNLVGFGTSVPFLICPDKTAPCVYQPASDTACATAVNGSHSGWFGFIATAGVHGHGQTFAFADGHAKFKSLSLDTHSPAQTDYRREPWASYDLTGAPEGSWDDGDGTCHVAYFGPNYDYQQ